MRIIAKIYPFLAHLPQFSQRVAQMIGIFLLFFTFSLPQHLFTAPTCMVLDDCDGNLLGARVAADGQWRFPAQTNVPEKFETCLTEFEDRRFYWHIGIDPIGLGRAIWQNLQHKRIISGGSTLTTQVIRLSRGQKKRTVTEKIIELFLALRLEYRCSKPEIMALYASNAPFGGNVVGLNAASWRYFEKEATQLSWGEAAMLAVLPNAPALIHLNKNRNLLLQKRNRLLDRLYKNGTIDALTLSLAKNEPLPEKPHELPNDAPHLLDRAYEEQLKPNPSAPTRLRTTLRRELQAQAADIAARYHKDLQGNKINNLACMIMDNETNQIIAYIGNVGNVGNAETNKNAENGAQVDIINSPRSTGSIMKPFLYALLQEEGQLLPNSLVPDIPTTILGYRPQNYAENFDGVIAAHTALARSLNIPAVRELNDYGVAKFHQKLRSFGITTLTRPPDYYGLPLILGGAEAKLYDLMGIYSSMSRTLAHFQPYGNKYDYALDWHSPNYIYSVNARETRNQTHSTQTPYLSAAACWLSFDAMQEVQRPTSQGDWESYEGSRRVAWKTGTSWGGRDAWAIGVTPGYTVGVWIGNANGEGRPGLIGVVTAAPVLFDLFNLLPQTAWWQQPLSDMTQLATCRQSGFRATSLCPDLDTIWAAKRGRESKQCPYHQTIHVDRQGLRVNTSCLAASEIQHIPYFVLPPLEEQYYKIKHPDYRTVPPFRAGCVKETTNTDDEPTMQWLYPRHPTRILVPIDLDGKPESTIFEIAHHRPETTVFWYLDDRFLGTTTHFHQKALRPAIGEHTITLVDADGVKIKQQITIVPRRGGQ